MRTTLPLVALVFIASTMSVASLVGCNPATGTGTKIMPGVGMRDYFTLRSVSGDLQTRDVRPEPRPREAITGDDYFQIKLEHIYIGDVLGREVGNVAIISELEGVLPKGVTCNELDVSNIGVDLNARERGSSGAASACRFKHVVAINPVFANGHVTFDSAFITPPFRMGRKHIGLRFLIAQLNDAELAKQLLAWGQEQLNNLSEWGLDELNLTQWQAKLIDIGFTVANYILDYAAQPDHVFEFETDFVPIETVGGVDSPQNLFMGGDFIIAGFPSDGSGKRGALWATDNLLFDSGRLYYKDGREEFREGPYIIFKVVRESRFAGELPVRLTQMARLIERGKAPGEVAGIARNVVLDLQDARIVNETEGAYLRDLIAWYSDARALEGPLNEAIKGKRREAGDWPAAIRPVGNSIGPDLALLMELEQVKASLEQLQTRIYDNYAKTPGMWQSECIAIRGTTQNLLDSYVKLHPKANKAFEDLQLARYDLDHIAKRSKQENERRQVLSEAEVWAQRQIEALPANLSEPKCPALRE